MKQLIINPLEWDTDYFKVNCGRLVVDAEPFDMSDFERAARDYDFISIQNVGNSINVNREIARHTDAFLVDVNVQFEKDVAATFKNFEEDYQSSIFKSVEIPDCLFDELNVDQSDFLYSKFVCDDKLNQRNGYLVYKEWLKNARNDKCKFFIVFKDKDSVGAYILFNIRDDVGTIELVKVNREFQGRYIATYLINEIERFLYYKQVKKIRVGTQLNNIPAMNLYHGLGFKEFSRTSIFHYWKR